MTSIDELSEREREILSLVATGVSNKEISRELVISINTVKVHLRNIYQKLDVASRTEATYVAIQSGLVLPDAVFGAERTKAEEEAEDQNSDGLLIIRKTSNIRILLSLIIIVLVVATTIIVGYQLLKQPDPISNPESAQRVIGTTEIDRWENRNDLPTGISDFATAIVDNTLYLLGGKTKDGVVNKVLQYNVLDDKWIELSPKPLPASGIDSVVIGNKIYIPGGITMDGDVSKIFEVFDPNLDNWDPLSNLPEGRSSYSAVAFEGQLYLFGGWDGLSIQDTVLIYNPNSDVWEYGSNPMPQPIMNSGAVVANGRIYIIGGESDDAILKSTYIYQPALDNIGGNPWAEGMALDYPRANMAAVSVADLVYILGGAQSAVDQYFTYQYSPTDNLWQPIEGPLDSQLSGLGAELMDSYIYSIGGVESTTFVSRVYTYKALYTILIPVLR